MSIARFIRQDYDDAAGIRAGVSARPRTARPKIAIVAASLDILGGQGVQADILAERLRDEGYEVSFIPVNPRFPARLQALRQYPYARTLLNQALYFPRLLELRRADVVHVFSASYWSFLLAPLPAILAAKSLGKRVVLNYHSGEADDHLAHWGVLVHPWLRLVDEIVVPSNYLQSVFARYGYRARVVRNVVDTARYRYRERAPLAPRLVSTRNLESIYRVDNTIAAFALLARRYPEATLAIAGQGSEERRLKQNAAVLAGDKIRFLGRVEPALMPRVYDQGDIFVNSSVVDNQPLSVLEAFAAGLPVVTTAPGEIAGMARAGETGSIVPADNPEAMAQAIADLLENPNRAQALARAARAEVEKYSWPAVRDAWAAVYAGEPA